jgi:serine phosphatase RsbU (regulator of sigma subunit)
VHSDPSQAAWAQAVEARFPYDPSAQRGVALVLRTGEIDYVPSVAPETIDELLSRPGASELDSAIREDAHRLSSAITVPLVSEGRTVGALQFVNAGSGRHHDAEDVALAQHVAGRTSDAFMKLWHAGQDRLMAATLQQAFLPPRLPAVPRLDLAARYWPANASAEIGGDFYDVFAIGPNRWALVIGDVCGTGPDAAAVAAIARHTARAAARHGYDHASVLEWVNHAVRHSDRELFCTMCYATIDVSDGEVDLVLRSASGGHPLPVRCRGRDATMIGRSGTLLGVFDTINVTVETTVLRPDELVVFYTDGVTDLPPPHGLDELQTIALVAEVSRRRSADDIAEAIHDDVRRRIRGGIRQDDVALLVARCLPAVAHRPDHTT